MVNVMEVIICLLVFGGMYAYGKYKLETKLDHYDMSKVDTTKLNLDMVNGVSVSERRRRCVNGYYDKHE